MEHVKNGYLTNGNIGRHKLKKSYYHSVDPEKPLSSDNIAEMWESCLHEDSDNGTVTWVRPYEKMTKIEMYEQAMSISKGLLAIGLKRGDNLVSIGVRGSDAPIMWIACSSIGVIFMQVITYAPIKKIISNVIEKVEPDAVVFGDAYEGYEGVYVFDEGKKIIEENNANPDAHKVKTIIYDRKAELNSATVPLNDWIALSKVIEAGTQISDQKLELAKSVLDINEPCSYFMSSGTTGKPKIILIGAATWTNIGEIKKRKPGYAFWTDISHLVPQGSRVRFGVPDWASEEHYSYLSAFWRLDLDLIVMPHEARMEDVDIAKEKLSLIEQYSINIFYATSYHLTNMVESGLYKKYNIESLKAIITGGSLSSEEFKRKVANIAPMSVNVYAISEFFTAMKPIPGVFNDNPNTVGKVNINNEIKIVDQDGVIVPVNTPGEICFRGYTRFLGYKNDTELTAAAMRMDGWYKTSDLGYMDEDGLVYVLGRIAGSEIFKVFDDVVYPSTIESILSKNPKIKECAAVGTRGVAAKGHDVNYVIVPVPNSGLTADEVREYAMQNMNIMTEWPARIVFLDHLPRTGARLKISRKELQKNLEDKIESDKDYGKVHWDWKQDIASISAF